MRTSLALLLVLMISGAATPAAAGQPVGGWRSLADLPQELTEVGAASLDGVVYVAGGIVPDPAIPGDRFYAYHPGSDRWHERAPIPHELVNHAPLTAYAGAVYLVGGFTPTGPTDALFIYDVASDTWRTGPPLPEPVGAHAVATTPDGKIHLVGGVTGSFDTGLSVTDAHHVFDIATGTWSALPPMPTAREHLGAAYLAGKIYAAAGRGPDSHGAEFEAYDVRTRQWQRLPDVPTPRGGIAMVTFAGQVYVLGGETFEPNRTYDQVERYHPHRREWTAAAPLPSPRHGLGGAALRGGIVVVAGGPEAGFTFSADTDIWRPGRTGG